MSDADLYFDAEVAALVAERSRAKADALAAERKTQREREDRMKERRRREKHMVSVDDDDEELCLLDVDAEKLLAALDEIGTEAGGTCLVDEGVMRTARAHYLAGRPVDAAHVLYPAIRDALGVAV